MNYRCFKLGDLMTNCFLIWSENEAGVIDPGGPAEAVIQTISEQNLNLKWILNTHGHADHIAGNEALQKKFGAPILIHQSDRQMLTSPMLNFSIFIGPGVTSPDADRIVKNGDILKLGMDEFTVIETPGHTPGGVSLYTPGYVFSGDTLFYESVGRADLPGGNYQLLIKSIKEQLLTLPPETIVLPGHEKQTTIGHEMKYNPFILETNEF